LIWSQGRSARRRFLFHHSQRAGETALLCINDPPARLLFFSTNHCRIAIKRRRTNGCCRHARLNSQPSIERLSMSAARITPQWMIEQGIYPSTATRFYAKIKPGHSPIHCPEIGPCQLWTGRLNEDGYGRMAIFPHGFPSRITYVHRIAWMLAHGPIPEHLLVCHKCDTRNCINSTHLFLGTIAENNLDMWLKGRYAIPTVSNAHLSWIEVRMIRRLREEEHLSQWSLAKRFGVNQSTVSRILDNKIWVD